jgi:GT2 family glycosyltransferase
MTAPVDPAGRQHVTAVIVAHDGERWLPRLIAALEASGRRPDQVVAVDTGSRDGSHGLLVDALGPSAVSKADIATSYGDAVRLALSHAEAPPEGSDSWVWLLHDDCAPAADALECLLRAGAGDSSIGVTGCRVRSWPRGRRLLEVGVTITGTGHRETGVEPGEYDQGQYDDSRDALSVSSAAMLVRRSVWDRLDGFDPQLRLFGDDLDFGWRAVRIGCRVVVAAGAVVFHAEAAARGVRRISCATPNPHRGARRAALFTLLANARAAVLPLQYVRLLFGSLLRACGYLLGKLPSAAWNEVAAAASVLGRPDLVVAARGRRRALGGDPSAALRLLPPWWTPYSNAVDLVASQFVRRPDGQVTPEGTSAGDRSELDSLETGPVPDEAVNLPTGTGPLRWVVAHPLLTLLAVLAIAGLLASRSLWGSGYLQGGGLLPAPASAGDWWRSYGAAWHPVRLGSTEPMAPYVVALAIGGTALLGKAWLLIDLVILFAPVFAAIGAFAASGHLVSSRAVRIWMSATYALLPVVNGSTSAGRVGTVVATIVLPWLVLPVATALRVPGLPWRQASVAAGLLALLSAFAPVAGVLAGLLLVTALPWLVLRRRAALAWIGAVALALTGALLLPWSLRFLTQPDLLWTEAGRTAVATGAVSWPLAFGRVGAAGEAPWQLTVGLAVAALLALLRADTRPRVAAAWVVGAAALLLAALLSRELVQPPGATLPEPVWLGFLAIVAQAAAVVAAGLGADGVSRRIAAGSFGWRQLLVGAAVIGGVSAPVAAVLWEAARAPHGSLHRQEAVALPAYMADDMDATDGPRVLLLEGNRQHASYDILAGAGQRIGDESVVPSLRPKMTRTVRSLLTPGHVSSARLRAAGIGYVVSPRPVDPALAARLDATSRLARASTGGSLSGWQVEPVGTVSSEPHVSDRERTTRTWQLVGQGALWLVVLVAASPGLARPADSPESAA